MEAVEQAIAASLREFEDSTDDINEKDAQCEKDTGSASNYQNLVKQHVGKVLSDDARKIVVSRLRI